MRAGDGRTLVGGSVLTRENTTRVDQKKGLTNISKTEGHSCRIHTLYNPWPSERVYKRRSKPKDMGSKRLMAREINHIPEN